MPANASLISSLLQLGDDAPALIDRLSDEDATAILWDWYAWARPEQMPPPEPWAVWMLLAGRGFGKTRAGAEWIRDRVWRQGARRVILIAATPADARDIMIEGESGLLHVGPPWERPEFNPSTRLLKWSNGAIGHIRSGYHPEDVRGLEGDTLWCDELAAWEYPNETWDLAQFCMRIGEPKTLITTTPKPIALVRKLASDPGIHVTRGSTYDNRDFLAPAFFEQIVAKYEGTSLGQQEIHAAILDEAESALWRRGIINDNRRTTCPEMRRIVVSVDPAVSAKAESDETGVIAAGLGQDGHGYVLHDVSGKCSPHRWAEKVVDLYESVGADRVVAEANQGGDMVAHTLRTVAPNLPIKLVHATQGKRTRAEPIAALYEQGRIHHVGLFPHLEDQLCTWEPLGGLPSPDRLDALVWALTDLFPTRPRARDIPAVSLPQENYWNV